MIIFRIFLIVFTVPGNCDNNCRKDGRMDKIELIMSKSHIEISYEEVKDMLRFRAYKDYIELLYKEGSDVKISEEMREALGLLSKEPVTDEEIEQERLQLLNLKTSMDDDIYQDTFDNNNDEEDIELENCYPIYKMMGSLKLEVEKLRSLKIIEDNFQGPEKNIPVKTNFFDNLEKKIHRLMYILNEVENRKKCEECDLCKEKNIKFSPCNHVACCKDCAKKIMIKNHPYRLCPICDKYAKEAIKVYI